MPAYQEIIFFFGNCYMDAWKYPLPQQEYSVVVAWIILHMFCRLVVLLRSTVYPC